MWRRDVAARRMASGNPGERGDVRGSGDVVRAGRSRGRPQVCRGVLLPGLCRRNARRLRERPDGRAAGLAGRGGRMGCILRPAPGPRAGLRRDCAGGVRPSRADCRTGCGQCRRHRQHRLHHRSGQHRGDRRGRVASGRRAGLPGDPGAQRPADFAPDPDPHAPRPCVRGRGDARGGGRDRRPCRSAARPVRPGGSLSRPISPG